jgi:hypothetical protein
MSLIARLAALERRRPSSEPPAVSVMAIGEWVRVAVCHAGGPGGTETMEWGEYRRRFGERYAHLEQWVILPDDGTPVAPESLAASMGFGAEGAS